MSKITNTKTDPLPAGTVVVTVYPYFVLEDGTGVNQQGAPLECVYYDKDATTLHPPLPKPVEPKKRTPGDLPVGSVWTVGNSNTLLHINLDDNKVFSLYFGYITMFPTSSYGSNITILYVPGEEL